MNPILISGHRPRYDKKKLRDFIEHCDNIAPMARNAALDLVDGKTIGEMMEKYGRGKGYTTTLRARGRLVLTLALAANPERFGLEKLELVTTGMTTSELAEHCGVSNQVILSRVRRLEPFGLPMPEERSQGWWFPVETANLYIQSLGK